MVLGTTYYNAARAWFGTARNGGGPLLALRNACLAGAALVGALLAGEPAPSTPTNAVAVKDSDNPADGTPTANKAMPPTLPSPESVEKPKTPAVSKAPTSVLLPPIQSPDNRGQTPLSAHALSCRTASRQLPPPSLLEPPPAIAAAGKATKETTLEVVVGQTRVLSFPDVPHRVALAVNDNDPIATLREVPHKPCDWYLIGKKPGTTFLDVWLPDPTNAATHRVLHYSVRIRTESEQIVVKRADKYSLHTLPPAPPSPPPSPPQRQPQPDKRQAARVPAESIYQTLEQEINRTFPGCTVQLKQVGESLVVSGHACNIFEATRILTIARENAPGSHTGEPCRTSGSPSLQATLDNYAQAGGRHVVNLLRIPGERQIMVRVVVAEVNRAAARSLGLDFGIADKQATILPNRPVAAGSSTVAQNGWIGSAIRTLQDLHYAQSLAEPTLTTMNGQTARFKAGGEFPIPVVQPAAQGAVQGVAFRSYGVNLSIQPVVADTDRIRLTVEAEVSGTDPQVAVQVGGTAVPGLKVRNFESTVELCEGETLAVAGLIRGPTAGAASEQELVVLISPVLLNNPPSGTARAVNPLSPQEIERYLRSRNESVPVGDVLYLIGPQGYAGTTRQSSEARR